MSMKNLLDKMTQLSKLDETPKPPKKKVLKESAQVAPAKPSSLRELFNQLDEAMAPGQKPLPVLDPQNKQAGAGFVTSTNPAVQNMLKNLDPKDVQIAMAPGKPGQPMAPTAAGQPNPNQMAPGQAMQENPEIFSYHNKAPGRTGQQGPKDVLSLRGGRTTPMNDKEGYRDVVKGPRKPGDFPAKKYYGAGGPKGVLPEAELDEYFSYPAGRNDGKPEDILGRRKAGDIAKYPNDYKAMKKGERGYPDYPLGKPKGVLPEGDLPSSSGVDNRGAGLGAGRSQATFESKDSKEHKYEVCYTTAKGTEKKTTITASSIEDATKQAKKKHDFDSLDSIKKVKEEKKSVKEGTKGVNPFAKKDDKAPAKAPAKGKKPDFLDIDKDGDKKEPMKKAAADAKPGTKGVNPFAKKADKKKKTVKESMSHRMTAARLEGKAHGLKGHSHNGKHYEDMEEARCYHEGYKEGLDECHGMMPGMGLVGESDMLPATTGGMASQAMEDEFMEDEFGEGNAFTKALARTPKGGKFKVAGNTFTDTSGYDAQLDEYTFESLDRQLDALLNEGVSVSISRGQENAPNSVTITAQDAEADELLALVRNAGMGGIFGGDEEEGSFAMPHPHEMGGASEINAPGQIEVVDDHEGMLDLMRKFAGVQSNGPAQEVGPQEAEPEEHDNNQGDMLSLMNKMSGDEGSDDYEDEEGDSEDYGPEDDSEKVDEEECNECGMMESKCCCGGDKEVVDEVESEDQQEFEVAETNAPDTGSEESTADEDAEASEDEALATADAGEDEEEGEQDKTVQESDDLDEELTEWANDAGGNGTETTFEQDIDFMTKIISGGLNKQKSTGQATIPVIPGQKDRMGYSAVNESINDWAKLAGIKKN